MELKDIIKSDDAGKIMLIVSAKDLRTLLEDAMNFAMNTMKERDEPSFYTREELADKLHISLVTLQRWRKMGYLPQPVTIDGRVLYDKAKVRDVIQGNYKVNRKLNQKDISL